MCCVQQMQMGAGRKSEVDAAPDDIVDEHLWNGRVWR
jgi:hypothetical protein